MKRFKLLGWPVAAILMSVSFSACSNETEEVFTKGNEIKLTSAITPTARVANQELQSTQIVANQHVGVTIIGEKASHSNTDWRAETNGILTNQGDQLFWKDENIDITAYHPYNQDWNETEQTFSINTDQSIDKNYLNSDLLWVKKTVSKSSNPIELQFAHKLAKIMVGIQHEDGETEVTSAIVSICGTKPSATFNLSTGAITNPNGSVADIKAAQAASAAAIIIPQTINAGTKFIKVEFNGKTFYYTLSENKTFESGKAYDFTLTLKEKGTETELSLTSPTEGNITNWDSNNSNTTGDANEEETLAENMIVINNQPLSRALKVALGEEYVTINNEGYAVLDANYASTVTNINMSEYTGRDLISLNGIGNFVNLTHLYLPSSPNLAECNLSQNTALVLLDTYSTTALTSLDLSNNTSIQQLHLNENTQLSSLILTGCTQLFNLQIDNTALTTIDIPNKQAITNLLYGGSTSINFDLSEFPNLHGLGCKNKGLESLDLIPDNIKSQLQWLFCSSNNLTTLDLSGFTNLQMLDCSNNKIISLTLTQSLTQLECQNNKISALDISNLSILSEWHCGNQTDGNGNSININLTLTSTQKNLFDESSWSDNNNENITFIEQ